MPPTTRLLAGLLHGRPTDWGLRAIKSVLVVAGSLLRAEEGQVESHVLFRALRDFNVPKILSQVGGGLEEM